MDSSLDAATDSDPVDGGVAMPDVGPPPDDVDGYVAWQMQAGGVPGLAAAILIDGEVAWTGTYGHADIEADRVVTEDTIFSVASVSKTIAAVPLLRLVEDGLVGLDDEASEHLGFALAHPEHPVTPITVRMLMTHTSGLADNWPVLGRVTNAGDPLVGLEEFAAGYVVPGGDYYDAVNFAAEPGTDWQYCNAAFGVLGHLVENVSGASLRERSQSDVFGPLAMDSTGWFLADVDSARLATPYTYNQARDAHLPLEQTGFGHYPAGGLRTSLNDLTRFLRAFMNGGELDGVRVLEAGTVATLFELQAPELSRRQGLVWRYDTVGGRRYVGHSGATIGGSAQMLFRPEDNVGVILMTNGDSYIRARLGFDEGSAALEAILVRLGAESDLLAAL